MLLKCLILLYCAIIINAYYDFGHCPYPQIKNGFGRLRQRGNLVKYSCRPRFILMGNKYATCKNGHWDVPPPICIRPGCDRIPPVENSVTQAYHNDAWMLFFCFPGYNLVGSPVIYCDGLRWNGTAPTCVDSSAPVPTSCDFEDPQICGWKQDELHDFDWMRLNRRTPSSYLLTGPQFDHTLGKKGGGYYMYIESTSRTTNDTARLISPVFDAKLSKGGCFVFYYHMYGKGIGGLRVFQKPDNMNMLQVLTFSYNGTNKYLLFEQWGNQGNTWFTGYATLLEVYEDFQIVIEGIRGKNFMSDIAIDDVSIQQGENCTNIAQEATTPVYLDDGSCAGRCRMEAYVGGQGTCECQLTCVVFDTCCADYLETCEFSDGSNDGTIETSLTMLPQTQKLVASTPATTQKTIPYMVPISLNTPRTIPTKPTTTTAKATTLAMRTTKQETATTAKNKITSKITTVKTTLASSTSITTANSTTQIGLNTRKTPAYVTSKVPSKRSTFSHQTQSTTASVRTLKPSKAIADKKIIPKGTNSIVTAAIILLVLSVCCGALYGTYKMRTAAGCAALARWRGRATSDPEVRFLNTDIDVDINDD